MAVEDSPRAGNLQEESERNSPNAAEGRAPGTESSGKATGAERPKRTHRQPPVNAIEASRRPRKPQAKRGEATPGEESKFSVPSSAPASPLQRADSDPWTVPQSVRDRFVQ